MEERHNHHNRVSRLLLYYQDSHYRRNISIPPFRLLPTQVETYPQEEEQRIHQDMLVLLHQLLVLHHNRNFRG